jgi:sigma-B regulation protein RsbU (phosphoserine phosphatase)
MMDDLENIKVKRNLTALVEFSRIINSSTDLDFIVNNILLTCLGKFLATKGLFSLNIDGELKIHSSKGIPEELTKKFSGAGNTENVFNEAEFKSYLGLSDLCVSEKVYASGKLLGVICLGEKLNKAPYSEDDREFLRTILNISSTAIQNSIVINELKMVNRVLDTRLHKLNSLFELSKEFALFSESSKVARLLVYSVIGQLFVSRFAVITFNDSGPEVLESKIDNDELIKIINDRNLKTLESSITGEGISEKYAELDKLKIELVVPMQIQGETKGLIFLGKRINNQAYSDTDIEYVYSVGSLAIISLENKRLFLEALEKKKLEDELDLARDIQKNLFPHTIPTLNNFEISALNVSSRQVGGDYYDIIRLDEKSICVAIADVSGKGVPASLLMANLQAFLKTICRHGLAIDEATGLINDLVSENTADGRFITFFWGILNDNERKFNYVNAGHNPPLLIRDGKITKLDKGGIILGVMKTNFPYVSGEVVLKKNDAVVMFTDGVSEAMNKKGEEFSDERLEEIAGKAFHKSSELILEEIRQEVLNFTSGAVQSDDITLMVIKAK